VAAWHGGVPLSIGIFAQRLSWACEAHAGPLAPVLTDVEAGRFRRSRDLRLSHLRDRVRLSIYGRAWLSFFAGKE